MKFQVRNVISDIDRLPNVQVYGRVAGVQGMLVEAGGVQRQISVGDRCHVVARDGRRVPCEAVGFRNGRALLMPFTAIDGIGLGCRTEVHETDPVVHPCEAWLGRVINAFAQPVDGLGPLPMGDDSYPIRATPPSAHARQRVSGKVDLGVRAVNTFLTMCRGQRMGIFAGSGVGKSSILSMMAKNTSCDVSVIGLIGERGREAREFIEDDLGPEGMKRSVIVVSTSDESPLMRRQAAYLTLSVAEFFRDQGKDVLCMMDSVTRFAMAQREISLSAGEPPASKGYTPTVFAELPRLLERAGPGTGKGSITGLFTVLVDGDDHNEPISDAVRGILDGHIVLDRAIADRGRYPAVNILRSVSRTMPGCNNEQENALVSRARKLLATYEDMAELIRLGAYRKGTDPAVDEAVHYYPMLEKLLTQGKKDATSLHDCYAQLAQVLGMPFDGDGMGRR
ncbi:flagellar protein export ATPase FliI [Magnetospirillum sulfuroxidans]|uniref:Flagellum-specific ATP synthase n=1 Tax=Magnetospirillum sulfuroxidans TaxID=611300 RepID=A0ABS5IAG9_9PROT|nr:flagellar protein export ATPase FliI [Magnetospirillum sulfuroxidans]MBR9971407.1 flagellar protein export ATPase FliI [Magnetospirillum sulfuroxidans]